MSLLSFNVTVFFEFSSGNSYKDGVKRVFQPKNREKIIISNVSSNRFNSGVYFYAQQKGQCWRIALPFLHFTFTFLEEEK
jgi:hypothetical protein